jgi:hypothetical protein
MYANTYHWFAPSEPDHFFCSYTNTAPPLDLAELLDGCEGRYEASHERILLSKNYTFNGVGKSPHHWNTFSTGCNNVMAFAPLSASVVEP